MRENEGAAAPVDVPSATSEQAAPEQATPTNDGVQQTDAAPENAETTDHGNQEDASPEAGPKRLSRSQRMQRKVARLSTMLAEQNAELEQLRSKTSTAPQPPKEEDFNGDYFAYQRAATKWDTEQAINAALSKVLPAEKKPDVRQLDREDLISDLQERVEAAKQYLPNFDEVLTGLQKSIGQMNDALIEEIGESENGEYLLYHLAQNPKLAASINRMSPRDIAREIGRLESKVSLPQPKRQTQAPPPLTAPKGGASPPKDISALAKQDDLSAFIKARNEEDAARRR